MRGDRINTWPALALVAALAAPALAGAAIDPADVEPVGPRDAAYLDAVRWTGLQTEIDYVRPGAPFDPAVEGAAADLRLLPDADAERIAWMVTFAVLLAAVVLIVWRGGLSVSFRGGRDAARRETGAAAALPAGTEADLPDDAFLARLRGMADRRLALVLLAGRALDRAARANGFRIGRAQTARDVLRAVPRRWPHAEALRLLVREAEIVHFGGRDLPEERWRACMDAARPLLAAGAPG